jgi:hypothetical protein
MPDLGAFQTGHTAGEAKALVGPLTGTNPERVRQYLVLVLTHDNELFIARNAQDSSCIDLAQRYVKAVWEAEKIMRERGETK